MIDEYEANQLFKMLAEKQMIDDALSRAQDALTWEEVERSQLAYSYGQLVRAKTFLDKLVNRVLHIRTRRLEMPASKEEEHHEG